MSDFDLYKNFVKQLRKELKNNEYSVPATESEENSELTADELTEALIKKFDELFGEES